jgi:Fur family ferric uptake transcriptional regulator
MLHRRLRGTGRPGLATVYRTLRALGDSGLAQTFAGDGEVAYRLCSPAHHHHLTCERCGSVEEIPSCEVEAWAETVSRRRGFVLTAHTTDLVGVCGRCRASLSPPSSRSRKT